MYLFKYTICIFTVYVLEHTDILSPIGMCVYMAIATYMYYIHVYEHICIGIDKCYHVACLYSLWLVVLSMTFFFFCSTGA
jgi:hypothetical protein